MFRSGFIRHINELGFIKKAFMKQFIIIVIFISFLSMTAMSQIDKNQLDDTTYFSWGSGHVGVSLALFKNTATFQYLYREHLLTNIIRGNYSINGGIIHLTCESDCKNEIGFFEFIVTEIYDKKDSHDKYLFITSAGDTLSQYKTSIVDSSKSTSDCSKYLFFSKNDSVVGIYKVRDCSKKCFIINVAFSRLHPELVSFTKKDITFHGNDVITDGIILRREIALTNNRKKK